MEELTDKVHANTGYPQVSVIMSVHNGAKYLKEAVESILDQTYQDFEFIIINDASTDNTEVILQQFKDPRIRVIKNDVNLGLTKSLNKALKLARGEYIARMDADDISLPARFERQVHFLDTHPQVATVGTYYHWIDENFNKIRTINYPLSNENIKKDLLIYNPIGHGTVMCKKKVLAEVGFYDDSFQYAQDYDLWLRVSETYELANIPEYLFLWRSTDQCVSKTKRQEQDRFADIARQKAKERIDKQFKQNANQRKLTACRQLSIVHINTHNVAGGAAKVAWRLAEAQRNAGHNARLLVGYKTSNSEHSFSFPIEVNPSLQAKCLREGQLFYEFQGSHKLINNPIVESADILHFHNLHGNYFNPFSISALAHIKPVIWTLHDMQSFTGHCAHSFDCERWLTGCGSCPYLQTEPALSVDTSAQLWRDKKLIYDHSYLWIVTPSQWLKSKVEKGILQNHPVELIYNGLATDIFKPYDKREVRSKLGIPEDVLAIGSVGHGGTLANQWKGGQYIQATLDILWQKHKNVIFLNIGGSQIYSDKRYINTGHIEDENVLAQYYSCLDVFLYTPIADNCPLTILEALSCGVPIVSFNTGGIPELVRDSVDGYLVGDKNVSQLVQLIEKLASHPELRAQYGKNCRDSAISTFDNKIIADQYENIYKKCIDKYSAPLKTIKTFTLSRLPEVINTPSFVKAEISKYLHSDSDGKAMHDLVKSFDEYASVTQKKYQEYESELAAASDLIQLQKEKLEKLYIIEKAAKIMCELLYKAGADLGQFAEIFQAQKVDFGTDEASRFLLSGWGDNETLPDEGFTFNWAVGKSASLFLVLPQEKQCQMTAHIKSLEFSKPQIITIKIDGKQMGHWQLTNKWQWEEHSIQIDPDDNRPSVSIIEFEFSQNLKAEHEPRPLAVLFESLTLSTMR